MATKVHFWKSYGSWRFAACDCWTQTSVAAYQIMQRDNKLRIAASHVVLYGVKRSMSEKEALLPTKRIFWDCCRNIVHFLCGVKRVKRFVNVHLHCIVSNLKTISKMPTLPPWKIFCGRPCQQHGPIWKSTHPKNKPRKNARNHGNVTKRISKLHQRAINSKKKSHAIFVLEKNVGNLISVEHLRQM